jgi:hypothetical protein
MEISGLWKLTPFSWVPFPFVRSRSQAVHMQLCTYLSIEILLYIYIYIYFLSIWSVEKPGDNFSIMAALHDIFQHLILLANNRILLIHVFIYLGAGIA